ncbi:MAG TPA: hypothetical protein DF383_09975, partial [Deltaproteobacteria bacterium]|nr:hypothetical protein [Deltaproteobacteria bacterium]
MNFSVEQRSSSVLPGSGGRILLTLDDVTMNQVMTSLAWNNGEVLVAARSLHSGETLNFSLGGHEYLLRLQRLENHLIGMDYAYFELREASPSRLGVSSLDADIQGLYAAMRAKTGIHFVRNGKNYDVETAIAHLERKRAAAGA